LIVAIERGDEIVVRHLAGKLQPEAPERVVQALWLRRELSFQSELEAAGKIGWE
jgi:hypothetical protein